MAVKCRSETWLKSSSRTAPASLLGGRVRDRSAFEPTYADAIRGALFLRLRTDLLPRYPYPQVIRLTGAVSFKISTGHAVASHSCYRSQLRLSLRSCSPRSSQQNTQDWFSSAYRFQWSVEFFSCISAECT